MRPSPDNPKASISYYRIDMREKRVKLHRDLPPTVVWTYGDSFPGPVFDTRSGEGLLVEWVNELPTRHFLPIDHTIHGAEADKPEVRGGRSFTWRQDSAGERWLSGVMVCSRKIGDMFLSQ